MCRFGFPITWILRIFYQLMHIIKPGINRHVSIKEHRLLQTEAEERLDELLLGLVTKKKARFVSKTPLLRPKKSTPRRRHKLNLHIPT
ncbi:hypothetical protein HBH70_073920 [Parastagonospora nodorum]|nr:hypothetical protein HBH92_111170 [Parastagonospora nodorum]KAH4546255.1 hypothetical protein HBH85_079370 [Parastagonospora nodorum]KAH4556228.1 hypothetical protein HBH86_094390 [Parastagonospora nodorum]KAH4865952.1 hypothetical protein HBH59_158330 [Parastagonospora nodorum]KAH4877189.1 hypothetical protein HBH58_103880 [Parastagonospora nodorum]